MSRDVPMFSEVCSISRLYMPVISYRPGLCSDLEKFRHVVNDDCAAACLLFTYQGKYHLLGSIPALTNYNLFGIYTNLYLFFFYFSDDSLVQHILDEKCA